MPKKCRCQKIITGKYKKCEECRRKDNELHKAIYRKNKENGICVVCKKPNDRDGATCSECLKKISLNKKLLLEYKICPSCGKERLYGDEKCCMTCKAKHVDYQKKYQSNNREEYNRKARENHKKRVERRKAMGVCAVCGKRKPSYGLLSCEICRMKDREWKRANGYIKKV